MSNNRSEIEELLEASRTLNKTFRNLNLNAEDTEDFEDTYQRYCANQTGTSFLKYHQEKEIDRSILALDLSDNAEVWQQPLDLSNQSEPKMEGQTLEELVRQLTELQLNRGQPQQHQNKPGDVIKCCANIIIKFDKNDKNNLMNFLESVDLAMSLTDQEAEKLTILKFAKQRVVGSVSIASKTYVTLDSFKADVLSAFKPKRTVTEIESIIARLTQGEKESVDSFEKRVSDLKFDYEQASQAERLVEKSVLDEVRLKEMERKVSRAFLNGLKDHVIRFINERPPTITEAISVALEAESTSSMRFQNKKLAEQAPRYSNEKHQEKKKNDQKGNQKGNFGKNSQTSSKGDSSRAKVPKCYNCGKDGHIKPKCPELVQTEQGEVKALSARPSEPKRKNEGQNSKNGEACGASVSAKSLKIRSLH